MKVYRWAWRLVPSVKTSMSYLYVFIGISYDQLWFGVGSAQRSVIEHDSIAKEFVNLTQVLNLPAVAGSECLKCQVWASYFDKAAEQNLTGLATTFTHNISHNINIYIYVIYIKRLSTQVQHEAQRSGGVFLRRLLGALVFNQFRSKVSALLGACFHRFDPQGRMVTWKWRPSQASLFAGGGLWWLQGMFFLKIDLASQPNTRSPTLKCFAQEFLAQALNTFLFKNALLWQVGLQI